MAKEVSDAMKKIFSDAGKKGNRTGKSIGGKHSVEARKQKRMLQEANKEFMQFIDQSVDKILLNAATEISNDLNKQINREIKNFYNSYSPKSYKRTYNLDSAITRVVTPVDKNKYYAGIAVSSFSYNTIYGSVDGLVDVYHQDPDIVFYQVYQRGLHGREIEGVKPFAPSILGRIDKYFKVVENSAIKTLEKHTNKILPQKR